MTKDELLIELEELLIITKVGNDYFISENYQQLQQVKPSVTNKISTKKYEEILNGEENPSKWPYFIQNTRGRTRALNFMDIAKLPMRSAKGFMVRSLNKEAIIAFDKLVDDNPNVNAEVFIRAIRNYYTETPEFCKAFKNLIIEGDAMTLYNEELERELKGVKENLDPLKKPNQTWG